MDVAVHFKVRHRWLHSPKKPSVLGGGLLERARSTTLALLGMTTAVGLAMVALALNQSWPLVADSPIPGVPAPQEAIGKATVAAEATASAAGFGLAEAAVAPRSDSGRPSGRGGASARAPEAGGAPASAEFVVAPSTPAAPPGDAGGHKPAPEPPPTKKTPQAPAQPAPAQPEPSPQSPPVVETSPPATSSEAPAEASDDDDWDDDDDDGWGDDDDDWGHHRGRGHHWAYGHDDD